MRSDLGKKAGFYEGFLLALGLMGVTLLSIEAVRRVRHHPRFKVKQWASLPVIDGARVLEKPELDARPQAEANSHNELLESERVDFPPVSQRW